MRHRVNIVRESVDEVSFSDDGSDDNGASKLRKMLQQKLSAERKANKKVKVMAGVDDDEELDRDQNSLGIEEEEKEDWTNYRTGGPI
jgi:hypothetical protein